MAPELEVEAEDGRRLRGQRNRDAVVEAILELLREGGAMPSVTEVAERSGVSVRSVFRHFDDLESLHAAAVERQMADMAELYAPLPPDGPLADRLAATAARRAQLFEVILPVRGVAERIAEGSSAIAEGLEASRRALRHQLRVAFAPELDELSADERRDVVDALSAAASWHVWHDLRTVQGLSPARAEAALARVVRGLLTDALS